MSGAKEAGGWGHIMADLVGLVERLGATGTRQLVSARARDHAGVLRRPLRSVSCYLTAVSMVALKQEAVRADENAEKPDPWGSAAGGSVKRCGHCSKPCGGSPTS